MNGTARYEPVSMEEFVSTFMLVYSRNRSENNRYILAILQGTSMKTTIISSKR